MARKTGGTPRTATVRQGGGSAFGVFLLCVLIALVAAMGGFFVGHFMLLSRAAFGQLTNKTSISEKQLDKVVGTYRYKGKTYDITAREAIAQESSLDSMRNDDGSYRMPSTESVISAARTAVLMREVEERGISASDDEVASFASQTFGTSDMQDLARMYGMDEDTVRDRVRESTCIAKLRQEVAPAAQQPPAEPVAPEDGDPEAATADYANYIIALAGSEWDATNGIWVEGGPFATALKEYNVSATSATYAAAQTAYNVAYQQYSADITGSADAWTAYVNDILCKASIAASTLAS
ncbi:MAG: hypothetical protein IKG11_02505 [Atopobiaceae bacterium]|nr:hypothetical protein [Atopobiaceae bacterium]